MPERCRLSVLLAKGIQDIIHRCITGIPANQIGKHGVIQLDPDVIRDIGKDQADTLFPEQAADRKQGLGRDKSYIVDGSGIDAEPGR
ncbi:MAG: hypothetical protein WBQ78_02290 [Gammaproteobacteria bacterium]